MYRDPLICLHGFPSFSYDWMKVMCEYRTSQPKPRTKHSANKVSKMDKLGQFYIVFKILINNYLTLIIIIDIHRIANNVLFCIDGEIRMVPN
jgi:hypothetical protein